MKYNALIPELSVKSIEHSKNFYSLLGFTIVYERDKFAFLQREDAQIMIEEINETWKTAELIHPFGRGMNLQIYVSDIEGLYKTVNDVEIGVFAPLKESDYDTDEVQIKVKEFLVQDPDGYVLRFQEDVKIKEKV